MDIPFIKLKSINELEEITTFKDGNLLFEDGDGELKRMTTAIFYQMLHNIATPISPSDATPTEIGWYKPQISSELDKPTDPNSTTDWGEKYPNAGDLRAKSGYDTLFYFSGTNWKKTEVKFPGNEDEKKVLKSFLKPTTDGEWEPMVLPSGEHTGAVIDQTNNAIANQYGVFADIFATSLVGVSRLRFVGEGFDQFGNGIAWWLGFRADGSFDVLKKGTISSGTTEIILKDEYVKYRYSRPTWITSFQKKRIIELPVEEDSVWKAINAMGSGYAGFLDLTTNGLKESNTAAQNTTIINSAIEGEAGVSTARIIMFPPGNFKVNEIIMKPGTKLAGAGVLHTRLYTDVGSTARAIIMQPDGGNARGSIRDILIDARETTEGGVYINNTFDFQIDQCIVFSSKQYGIWMRGGLYHSISNVYFLGSDIQLKTTHLTAMATNLIAYHRLYFDGANKKCVELNAGSNYSFTSCNFENAGIAGDDNTGGGRRYWSFSKFRGCRCSFQSLLVRRCKRWIYLSICKLSWQLCYRTLYAI